MNIAANLRFYRKNKEYSQLKVASLINCDRSLIAKYENNEILPPIDILVMLADLYEVSVDELVGRKTDSRNALYKKLSNFSDGQTKLAIEMLNSISKYNIRK